MVFQAQPVIKVITTLFVLLLAVVGLISVGFILYLIAAVIMPLMAVVVLVALWGVACEP